jgi:aryl-alcohol dehydrogenase-like predicted oxidoreductase
MLFRHGCRIRGLPAGLVIATKAGFDRPGPDPWVTNGRPEHLRAACEESLRRLSLDRIDLFQLHRIDSAVPAEDQLGALKDMQAQGKIKHIGLSEVSVAQIEHARTITPIVTVQNRYSVVDRAADDVVDYLQSAAELHQRGRPHPLFCIRSALLQIPRFDRPAASRETQTTAIARQARPRVN